MSIKTGFIAALAAAFAMPALAGDIVINDAYARSSGKMAKAGAAFMSIQNTGAEDDRLVGAKADIAARVELHTHKENSDGVMQMLEVKEGFAIPAGGEYMLQRGGDHVMFMGLLSPMTDGETVPVTLIFEKAGEVQVDIPVDLRRKPMHGGGGHMAGGHGQKMHQGAKN